MSTLVAPDLSCFEEDLGHLYFVFNLLLWRKEFHLETEVRDRQELLVSWQNVEFSRLRLSDRPKYYCRVSS